MTPDRWAQVKQVFEASVDLPLGVQAAQVRFVCGDDTELELEVNRLLEAHRGSADFLEQPIADLHRFIAPPLPPEKPLLADGVTVANRFKILRFLSRGGMGEVYEAWDADLGIAIALKTIRPRIASDAEAIERFKNEVKHAREISHPNICRVHELFSQELLTQNFASQNFASQNFASQELLSQDSAMQVPPDQATRGLKVWFLSMELLPGATLLEHLRTAGPLAPREALAITRQLVGGLAAAHAQGLVHRDFKSSNVILVPDASGSPRAVITDFGLSLKMLAPGANAGERAGMGTPAYMAPEQQRGGEVGPLADQYALGAVLCEMLTGSLPRWSAPHGPHHKPILELPEPRSAVKPDVPLRLIDGPSRNTDGAHPGAAEARPLGPPNRIPARWKSTICRCLETDPAKRFPQIEDVLQALDPPSLLRRPAFLAVAAALLVAALIGGDRFWTHRSEGCHICDLVQLTPDTDESESPAISRDSHTVAYSSDRADSGNLDIFLQHLPGGRPIRLTHDQSRDRDPSLSPNGSVIAFRSERDGGGIYLVDAAAGSERLVAPRGRNPVISPDGKNLLFWTGDVDSGVASGKIFLLSMAGGHPVQLAASFEDARFPVWSPDGRAFLFSGCPATPAPAVAAPATLPGCSEWWAMSLDGNRVVNTGVLARLRSKDVLLARPNVGFWYQDGLLLSAGIGGLRNNLWSIPLDPRTWQAAGDPRQLLDNTARDFSPSLSATRAVTYTRLSGALHVWQIEHALDAGRSSSSRLTEDPDIDNSPFVADGGRWLVFARGWGSRRSIWIRDNNIGAESLLLSSGLPTRSPLINPAGNLMVYEQSDPDGPSLYAKTDIRGPTGQVKRLCHGCSLPSGWFNTDQAFFYRDGLPSTIHMADPRSGATHTVLEETGASLDDATWSPANQHLLFTETNGGVKRIFAARLPQATAKVTGKWILIPDAGVSPQHARWSGDGRTIVYVSNSDGFTCIYGWSFSPEKDQVIGRPFPIAHFHNARASIDNVFPRSFNLSVDRDSVFFNLGEQTSTIWTGQLKKQ